MNLAALNLAVIKHKLQWSAEGEWSAHITPEESALLLRELNHSRSQGRIEGMHMLHQELTKPKGRNAGNRERGKGQRSGG